MKRKSLLILLMVSVLALSSCNSQTFGAVEDVMASESSTQAGVSDPSESSSESALSSSDESSTTASSDQSSETASSEESSADSSESQTRYYVAPEQVTLTGRNEDHLITDKICYIEGEKFFLLLDKDIDLPGDFAVNIGLLIDELEKETGLSFETAEKPFKCDASTTWLGYDPWEYFDFGKKVPIYIWADREDVGYISCAGAEATSIVMYELFSDSLWNSVPSYRDNAWRRRDYVYYYEIAHEILHTLTQRHAEMTKILTEGSADYYAVKAVTALAPAAKDFASCAGDLYLIDTVKDTITPETAEAVFRNDYADLSQRDRGDEYTLGRHFCTFLAETYGDMFLRDFLNAAEKSGYRYRTFVGNLQESDIKKQYDICERLFGEDVFERFGAWYQEHVK